MPALIYIADPMCSWCYGFDPELARLLEGLPGMKLDVMVGGLRPNNTQPIDAILRTTLLEHWKRVHEASGLTFCNEALAHEGLIYNTEPACRAVVAARTLAPEAALKVFQAIQHAFYAEGLNVTQGEVLAQVASIALTRAGCPIDTQSFHSKWMEESVIAATHADFVQTQRWGIFGFPTLILEHGDKLDLVTSGYVKTEALVERMQAIIDQAS